MRQLVRGSSLLLAAVVAVVLATSASGTTKVAAIKASKGPLETGIDMWNYSDPADNATELQRMSDTGARYVPIRIEWSSIAPGGSTQPAGFNPRDPADPNYNWSSTDDLVKAIAGAGLKPIVIVSSAPLWAEPAGASSFETGTYKPSPNMLADFLTAAATRYSGSFDDLPRVQYWSVWNEPNLGTFLNPQKVKGKPYAATWYRNMLNKGADALHAVYANNVVIAGETAPFGSTSRSTKPITFMEQVLCISEKKSVDKKTKQPIYTYKSGCRKKTKFDAWSHHPYTQGGPTTQAGVHGDASLGDMNTMRLVLNAAIKAHHVVASRQVRLLVTEFSWDSKPPDPKAVPIAMETRWVSQMLYQMWSSGVSIVNWFLLDDQPFATSPWQSGLYYYSPKGISSDKPKPVLRAFRFPFVALKTTVKKKTTVLTTMLLWGRTPTGKAASVVVERRTGRKWKRVKTLHANRYGIFHLRIALPAKTTSFRARLSNGRDESAAFEVKPPKHPWHGCVFGTC
jgi:hypothetical protein